MNCASINNPILNLDPAANISTDISALTKSQDRKASTLCASTQNPVSTATTSTACALTNTQNVITATAPTLHTSTPNPNSTATTSTACAPTYTQNIITAATLTLCASTPNPDSTIYLLSSLQSVNEQNSYLTGLISVKLVKQRRPRKDENLAKLHDASFAYIVRVTRENQVREIPNFSASNGCLEGLKRRHDIAFKKAAGENKSVDQVVCNHWTEDLLNLLEGYEPDDIYNADETDLFFKCLPDKTFTFKGEKCHGGKQSKERLTLLQCVNMDRLPLLTIGKSKRPRCVKGEQDLPEENDVEVGPSNEEWNKLVSLESNKLMPSFEDFVRIDDDVTTAGEQTDDDIVKNCVNTCITGNDSEDEAQIPETEIKVIPMKLALNALETVDQYFEYAAVVDQAIFDKMYELEKNIQNTKTETQRKLTDFFKCK
ncbi:unnamed protein product [Colias eurytheme]|nr:unnamed protein product [Colias eurytheme]